MNEKDVTGPTDDEEYGHGGVEVPTEEEQPVPKEPQEDQAGPGTGSETETGTSIPDDINPGIMPQD